MDKIKFYKRVSFASGILLCFSILKSFLAIFVRSSIANFFGAVAVTDAYFAAFTIPQQLGDFLIGGIIFAVIIPVFQRRRVDAGEEKAYDDVSGLLNILTISLLTVTTIYYFLIPYAIPMIFLGFKKETLDLTIKLSKWLSPAILLMGLSLIYVSFYHAHRDFITPSVATLFFPVSTLMSLWLLPSKWGIERLIAGNLVGVTGGLLLLIVFIHRKIKWKWNWSLKNPLLTTTLFISFPVIIADSVGKIIPFIQKSAASKLPYEGAISLMEYSLFIVGAVLVLISGPVSTAVFPLMGEQKNSEDHKLVLRTFSDAFTSILFLSIPVIVLFYLQSNEIIRILFGYGNFTDRDVYICGRLLIILSSIIIPACLGQLLFKVFLVYEDTFAISIFASIATLITIPFYYILCKMAGIYGLAFAYVITYIAGTIVYIGMLKYKHKDFNFYSLALSILPFMICALFMFISGILIKKLLVFNNLLILKFVVISCSSFSVYLIVAYVMKVKELHFIGSRIPLIGKIISKITVRSSCVE
jgi:putative peptidoglycan lipid II flippase